MKFAQFMTAALPAYDAGKKAGLTPQQMLDEKAPGYIGKLIPQFQRTNAEKLRDTLSASNPDLEAATPGAKSGLPAAQKDNIDLNTKGGIITAYKAGYFGLGPDAHAKAIDTLAAKGFAQPRTKAPLQPSAPIND
jgi:hypothetical protein